MTSATRAGPMPAVHSPISAQIRRTRHSGPSTPPSPVVLLLCLPLLVGMLGTPVATADDLSDAIAQQKALQARSRRRRRRSSRSAQQPGGAVGRASPRRRRHSNGINANLADVQQARSRRSTANVALTKASPTATSSNQLASIDGQLSALQNDEIRRQKALVKRKALLADRIRAPTRPATRRCSRCSSRRSSFTDALSRSATTSTSASRTRRSRRRSRRTSAISRRSTRPSSASRVRHRGAARPRRRPEEGARRPARRAQGGPGQAKAIQQARPTAAEPTSRPSTSGSHPTRRPSRRPSGRPRPPRRPSRSGSTSCARPSAAQGRIPSVYNGTLSLADGGQRQPGIRLHRRGLRAAGGQSCSHFHQGIDIVAPYGTPVRASGPGTVLYVGWNYADGYDPAWIVIIAHCSSLETWYAHMQPIYPVRAGQSVVRRPGRRLRRQYRPLDGRAPPLGRALQRRVRESAAVRLGLARRTRARSSASATKRLTGRYTASGTLRNAC